MKRIVDFIKEASLGKMSPNVCDYSATGRKVTCWLANDKEFFSKKLPKLDLITFDTDFEEMDYLRITFDFDNNTIKVEFPDMWTAVSRMCYAEFKCDKQFDQLISSGTKLKVSNLKSQKNNLHKLPGDEFAADVLKDCADLAAAYFNNMSEPLF
jgi:hypothetical protein